MKSIRAKLMISISALTTLILILIGIISIQFTKSALIDKTKEILKSEVENINTGFNSIIDEVNYVSSNMMNSYDEHIKYEVTNALEIVTYFYNEYSDGHMAEEEAKESAKNLIKNIRYDETGYLWIDDDKGNLISHPIIPEKEGTNRLNLTDPNGVNIVKELISSAKHGKNSGYTDFMWEKPKDKSTGKLTPKRAYSGYFSPWNWVISTGNYLDNINKDIELTKRNIKRSFQKSIEDIVDGNVITVLSSNGEILYYTNKELVGTKLNVKDEKTDEDMFTKIQNSKNEFIEYTIKDTLSNKLTSKIGFVSYNEEHDAYVVIASNTKNIFASVNNLTNFLVIVILLGISVSLLFSYFLSNNFTKPILELKTISEQVSNGDLTINIETNENNELGVLKNSFNKMIHNLKTLVDKTSNTANSVSDSTTMLANMIDQSTAAITQVSAAVEEVASGAVEQARLAEEGVYKGNHLEETTNKIKENANEMKASAQDMRSMGEKGKHVMNELTLKQNLTNSSIEKIFETVNILGERIKSISEFTNTISQISEQTNLLALNAAIEAARVGDQGRGFAVVADEIRKLAEESNKSAEKVQQVISNIQTDALKTVEVVQETKNIFNDQNIAVVSTEQIFTELGKTIDNSLNKIENLYSRIDELNIVKAEVTSNIEEIDSTCEQAAAATEEVSASVEEQNATMQEINAYVKLLKNNATEMKDAINKFKI